MAQIHIAMTPTRSKGPTVPLWVSISGFGARVLRRIVSRYDARRARILVLSMDDRTLRDIGSSRLQLAYGISAPAGTPDLRPIGPAHRLGGHLEASRRGRHRKSDSG